MPAYLAENLKRLHLAVVLQAICDFRQCPEDTRVKYWLLHDGLHILEAYDQPVNPEHWKTFIEQGCPGKFNMTHKTR